MNILGGLVVVVDAPPGQVETPPSSPLKNGPVRYRTERD
jgi:hypothetical protein